MKLLLLIITFAVDFGFRWVHSDIGEKVLASNIDIQLVENVLANNNDIQLVENVLASNNDIQLVENFQHLFESILRNDTKKTREYSRIFSEEKQKLEKAYSEVKMKMNLTKHRIKLFRSGNSSLVKRHNSNSNDDDKADGDADFSKALKNNHTVSSPKILPINMHTLEEIQEHNAIYVDKTEFATKLLQNRGQIYMLMRPRRYGKSLFLNVLQSILLGKKTMFKDYYIGKSHVNYSWKEHSVIRLVFTQENSIQSVAETLKDYAVEHGVVQLMNNCNATNSLYFKELIMNVAKKGKPVAVLIDEYDRPFQNSDLKTRCYFFEIFDYLKTLTDDRYIRFTFITGRNKRGFGNHVTMSSYSIYDISRMNEYSSVCGFTLDETRNNFHHYIEEKAKNNGVLVENVDEDIREWVNRYHFTNGPIYVHNPTSIVSYLQEKHLSVPPDSYP